MSKDIITTLSFPFFALCIDKTTDMSVTKQLIVYCSYVADGEVMTKFLHVDTLPDGIAVTIADRIHQLCTDLELDLKRICGLGSDGASVMLGNHGGVSTLLKQKLPYLVANHCVARQLALAFSQAANEIPYLKRFKDICDQLFSIIRIYRCICLA